MKLHVINAGMFKLDGGAMFGVVPRVMWKKLNPPDENNLCTWALRCMLIEDGDRRILIDTGMGTKQGAKFQSHFHPHGDHTLESSLKDAGFNKEDITDVFLTHFHFDHVGGAVAKSEDGQLYPAFPNAIYWTNQRHYDWAMDPNPREKASFLKENFVPLEDAGVLNYLKAKEWEKLPFSENIDILFSYGHTEAMMHPIIKIGSKTIVFCADLLASQYHVGMPYVMSYDIRPLTTLKEKKIFFEEVLEGNYILFLEHDPVTECITLTKNEKGRIVVDKIMTLREALES